MVNFAVKRRNWFSGFVKVVSQALDKCTRTNVTSAFLGYKVADKWVDIHIYKKDVTFCDHLN